MSKKLSIFGILGFLLLLQSELLSASESAATNETCTSEEKGSISSDDRATSILVILTLILVLSFIFEWFKHFIAHHVPEGTEPALNQLWSELSVLGFISFTFFIFTRASVTQTASQDIFGDDMALIHLIEQVHYFFFICMLFFLIEVFGLLYLSKWEDGHWRSLEEKVRTQKESILENWWEAMRRVKQRSWTVRMIFKYFPDFDPYRKQLSAMDYLLFREKFLYPEETDEIPLDDSFRFCDYMTLCLGEKLGAIVKIHPAAWLSLEILLIFVWLIDWGFGTNELLRVFSFVGWLVFFVVSIFDKKVEWIRRRLTPKIPDGHQYHPESQLAQPSLKRIEIVDSSFNRRVRNVIPLTSKTRTEHIKLFWFGHYGEAVITQTLSLMVLISAIFISLFAFVISDDLRKDGGGSFAIYFLVTFVPLLFTAFYFVPRVITRLVLITSIETMKNVKYIKKVNASIKTQKTLKLIKIVRLFKLRDPSERLKTHATAPRSNKPISLEREQQLLEAFGIIDKERKGVAKKEALLHLLDELGVEYAEEFRELLAPTDGNMTFAEFRNFMALVISFDEEATDVMVQRMFGIFDQQGTGTVSAVQFQHVVSALGQTFSPDDIRFVFDEVDLDHDGMFTVHDFRALLERYQIIDD